MIIKDKINTRDKLRNFSERDYWWCNCGKNVGVEINGKDELYLRPFIVLKKLSKHGFIGIPTTTQKHNNKLWFKKFIFKDKTEYASLSQVRIISAKRLHRRIGRISSIDFEAIRNSFLSFCS